MTRFRAMQIGAMAAGASFVVAGVAVWVCMQGQGPGAPGAPVPASAAARAAQPTVLPSDSSGVNLRDTNDVRVYKMVKDAVVNISASRVITQQISTGNDFFDRFAPQYRQVPGQSLGSGFVIHPSGYIITNEHVVDEGTDVQCVFFNGEKLPAQVIATDNDHDLAVLKVEPKAPLHALELGSSEDLMIGEPVSAIGNPYGFAGTMTSGIVSALDRSLQLSETKSYTGLIQTDASINPGNSGGPLLNAYGQVVGINTAIRQGATGIGFAISVSNMRDLLPAFLNPELLNRAQVGFIVEEKRQSRPPASVLTSVRVEKVQAGSDAEKGGLKNDDQLLAVGGTPVNNVVDALVAMGSAKAGDTMALHVLRGGTTFDLKVPVSQVPMQPSEMLLLTKMGLKGQTITPALVSRYKLPLNHGVFIDSVEAGSAAAKSGVQAGDVLLQLGIYRVGSIDNVADLLKTVDRPVDAQIVIIRGTSMMRGVIALK